MSADENLQKMRILSTEILPEANIITLIFVEVFRASDSKIKLQHKHSIKNWLVTNLNPFSRN